jgi:tRNA(Ile)-lysidine synthase
MSAPGVEARVRATGLLDGPVVVLLSGGRDSVCLLDLAVRLAPAVWALHVDHGLRPDSGDDAAHCAALCARLGVELEVVRAGAARGNVQAWARGVRREAAEAAAARRGAVAATGHTATDQVETVLQGLAGAPGRRALLGMPARSGRLVRPLLGVTREETAAHCRERGLPWREDPANAASARGRLRAEVLPVLRALHPAAEANVLRTVAQLREEAEALGAALDAAGAGDLAEPGEAVDLAALPPALARLALQRLADAAAGAPAPAVAAHLGAVLALRREGTAAHDLPGALRAVSEYGRVRVERRAAAPAAAPPPAVLPVPGAAAWGAGRLTAERGPGLPVGDGTLDAQALGGPVEVRAWRPGDRMRPLGLGGARALQDLFTDRKVPRERRRRVPVVVSGGRIAWVPGVATGEAFAVTARTGERVRLRWHA